MVGVSIFTPIKHVGVVEVNIHYILTPPGGQQSRSKCLGQVNNILQLSELEPRNIQIVGKVM